MIVNIRSQLPQPDSTETVSGKPGAVQYESLINRVGQFRARGVIIDRVLANAFTSEGAGMCKSFGLREVGPHKKDGIIFEGRLSEHPRFT